MKLMKFGGASLRDAKSAYQIARIIASDKEKKAVVLSAVEGVTDQLIKALKTVSANPNDESFIKTFISKLRKQHLDILSKAIKPGHHIRAEALKQLQLNLDKLERLFYGVSYIEEISPGSRDLIISFGERLSVILMAEIIHSVGRKAEPIEADKIGLITDGDFGKASAILPLAAKNIRKALCPLIKKGVTPIITGFFGCDKKGRTTIFGRGGSDYSASVIAYALDAEKLELWKDIDGFMSVSPKMVKEGRIIDKLSYDEAAEMAYFGMEILHPRMVEPAMLKNIPIIIKNTFNPSHNGTAIVREGYQDKHIIKGIAYDKNISALKIHGAGVGYKPGVLEEITANIAKKGINIKSVITSQTCINLLLNKEDLNESYETLKKINIRVVEHLERVTDIALIGIVGEGIIKTKGLAARVFNSVAKEGINVDMISAGASSVAYYFIIKNRDLEKAVKSIYNEFFKGKKSVII
jgi:aspartate kinase